MTTGCGLAGEAEIEEARSLDPLPVVAFDGVQGVQLGSPGRALLLALPFAPSATFPPDQLFAGIGQAGKAAKLVVEAQPQRCRRASPLLASLRASTRFDEHGDPVRPEVWLWNADPPGSYQWSGAAALN